MALTVAKTKYGVVRGMDAENKEYSVFKGIPFAKPPIGELRFKAPMEPEAWEGEKTCDTFSAACIQLTRPGEEKKYISEDCLYLNIYTPANSTKDNLPVMFWIFGGGFSAGSASDPEFDGKEINKRGVILVTINYRCNIMGFFSHPELDKRNGYSGNVGLLDEIAALKWVKENIKEFGGDPQRVLVHGQSAGGISTRILLTSPLSQNLFSRAIVQSGGGLNEADLMRTKEDFQDMCLKSMEHLGWSIEDMLSRDALEITAKMNEAVREIESGFEVAFFQPFIDHYVLHEVPGVSIYDGDYMKIPIICGSVAGDSWMFSRKVLQQLEGNQSYARAFSFSPGYAWARHQVDENREPIYTYYMDRKQNAEVLQHGMKGKKIPYGASTPHGTEVAYVFGTLQTRGTFWNDEDFILSKDMTDYWTNFAKTGDPNGEGLPSWSTYSDNNQKVMHFGDHGIHFEEIVKNKEEMSIIQYVENHPGMLENLEEF